MITIVQILENIFLLSFLGVSFYTLESSRSYLGNATVQVLHGLSFGLFAFLVTSTPVLLADGATVDARAGPVILAGVVAGPLAGLIAACLGGLARGMVGGSFAISGVVVYALYGAIGVGLWYLKAINKDAFLKLRSLGILAGLSCLGAGSIFFVIQPLSRAIEWAQRDLPYILVANTLSVIYATAVLGVAFILLDKTRQIAEANETLTLAKRAGRFGIWDFDINSGAVIWDDKSKELHGINKETEFGTFQDWVQNVHPDDLKNAENAFYEAIDSGETYDIEYRSLLPDGEVKIIKGDAIVLRDSSGEAVRVVGTNTDLTDIRATEARLKETQLVAIQAQKFDTIGQLTGGVAHDFNNLLAVIMGNMELLKDEIERRPIDLEEAHSLLDAGIEATKTGAELTQNMLAYARKARLTPERLDLNEVVRATETWMRRTIPSRIQIETNLQAGLWQTHADKSSLQSAVVNLLVNAQDAFDGSGEITIETSNLRVDEDYVVERQEDIVPGRYVMLAVSDTGRGIDPDILTSIFDPFFTTKSVGKGSGLGLSMVQGFVKQSGGAIRVYSEPGVGTSFKLFFPASVTAENAKAVGNSSHPQQPDNIGSGRRILLVEDRHEVLVVLRKILRGAGFDVVTAKNGDQGFEVFSASGKFDLVVTDIVMPGELQGPSMARKIRELDPSMSFIFLSGYASEATVHGNGLTPEDIRLMKPISRDALLSAVEKCLSPNDGI